ncbi:unnamed protein product [Clonostachys rosea f. rosea IK726]|uniref:Uncharacterized protein n=1 Tax=Clonostachys rosea f. rosea IK726 TaxID=1349383 RepID=A0ACA9UCT6_BIOOC|nr:unnamed protein product [Clonostachys rosea f. rosea IK726]
MPPTQNWILNVEEHRSADLALEGVEPSPARGIDNRWAFDHLPADRRPTVLRDMKQWFREFKVVPDSLRSSGGEAKLEERMRLFQKHGWPDAFDSKSLPDGTGEEELREAGGLARGGAPEGDEETRGRFRAGITLGGGWALGIICPGR